MGFAIRPWTAEDGYDAIARIASQTNLEPLTPEQLLEGDRRLPTDTFLRRWLALEQGGRVVGYGHARHMSYEAPGRFTVRAAVDWDARGAGVGRALAHQAEATALGAGATELQSFLRDDDEIALAFAQRRGYAIDKHSFESILQVASARDAEFEAVIGRLEAEGIRFLTCADALGEATERGLYEVDKNASLDNPGEDLPDFLPFAEWRKWVVAHPLFRPDLMMMAADGDRIIGMSELKVQREKPGLNTGFTGVLREYRGRGIALALKINAIRAARRIGAPYIRTNNDSRNGPMLAINRKLGFVREPGIYTLLKRV